MTHAALRRAAHPHPGPAVSEATRVALAAMARPAAAGRPPSPSPRPPSPATDPTSTIVPIRPDVASAASRTETEAEARRAGDTPDPRTAGSSALAESASPESEPVESTSTEPAPAGPAPTEPAPTAYAATRRDGWTVERQRRFLATLAESGSVNEAAKAAGMTARSAHRLRARADGAAFADGWDQALILATERLVDLAFERATVGAESVTLRDGEEVRRTRTPSDRMLCFLLTHLHADRFGAMSHAAYAFKPFARTAAERLPHVADALADAPDEDVIGGDVIEDGAAGAHQN